jgi:hypothetical protein
MKSKIFPFLLLSIVFVLVSCGKSGPPDPRKALMEADMDKLDGTSFNKEEDTLAQDLKEFFELTTNEALKPENFHYFTRISDDGKRILILAQMPKLKKAEKETRSEVFDILDAWFDLHPELDGLQRYIGVKGLVTMMLIRTPDYDYNGTLGLDTHLYDFYGPASAFPVAEGVKKD